MSWFHRILGPGLLSLGLVAALPASVALAADDDDDAADVDDEEVDEEDADPSATVVYRSALEPYGSWVETPEYGLVWVPNSGAVGPDFAPYVSRGHWELTEDGDWLWVSEYDWGYVPFHYGRWIWVSDVGWAWIPGRVYAPAWVVWRVGPGGYIGWAPYPATWYWVDGVAVHHHHHHHHAAYVFVHSDHCFERDVHHHVIHDKAEVHKAAQATHQHASPKHAKAGHKPASPTLDDAGIKKEAAPKKFGKADPRALAFADPKKNAKPQKSTGPGPTAPAAKTQPASYLSSGLREKQKSFPVRSKPAPTTRPAGLNVPSSSGDGQVVNGRTQPSSKPSGQPPSASRTRPSKTRAPRSRSRPSSGFDTSTPSTKPASRPESRPSAPSATPAPSSTPAKKARPTPTPTKPKGKPAPRRH